MYMYMYVCIILVCCVAEWSGGGDSGSEEEEEEEGEGRRRVSGMKMVLREKTVEAVGKMWPSQTHAQGLATILSMM